MRARRHQSIPRCDTGMLDFDSRSLTRNLNRTAIGRIIAEVERRREMPRRARGAGLVGDRASMGSSSACDENLSCLTHGDSSEINEPALHRLEPRHVRCHRTWVEVVHDEQPHRPRVCTRNRSPHTAARWCWPSRPPWLALTGTARRSAAQLAADRGRGCAPGGEDPPVGAVRAPCRRGLLLVGKRQGGIEFGLGEARRHGGSD